MTEFKRPGQEALGHVQAFVVLLIVVAGMFFVLRGFSPVNGPHTLAPHTQKSAVEVAKGAASAAPESIKPIGSMNIFERALFTGLAFTRSYVLANRAGSWGWAIVLLTIGINLLILPLRISGMRNALKMQRIQPKMAEIKARYKGVQLTDPRRNEMVAEITRLQKDNGISMAGGCVPVLLQFPILFAFLGMLHQTAALHGAAWLWLHDLSAADPLHILPVLMVVFQLLVQLYTPAPGADAKQQKTMAYLMTIGFGYVSWHYASAIALYALTGSIFSILSQAAMNRSTLGRAMKAATVLPKGREIARG